jgi:hypothetical protein
MKWVVNIKGKPESTSFEISVVRDDNEHGKKSYGWIGDDKILITHDGGPGTCSLTKTVWDKCVKVAHEVADELNGVLK